VNDEYWTSVLGSRLILETAFLVCFTTQAVWMSSPHTYLRGQYLKHALCVRQFLSMNSRDPSVHWYVRRIMELSDSGECDVSCLPTLPSQEVFLQQSLLLQYKE
jgi:hypothetical protein